MTLNLVKRAGVVADYFSGRCGFKSERRAIVLREQFGQCRQCSPQQLCQRPRRIDDKQAAAMHAETVFRWGLDFDAGVEPIRRNFFQLLRHRLSLFSSVITGSGTRKKVWIMNLISST